MFSLLKDHAVANVWSSPTQDYQYVFKPSRLGPASGNMYTVTVHRSEYFLPNSRNVFFFSENGVNKFSYNPLLTAVPYVVFDLGPLPPWLVNLPERKGKWYPIAELMSNRNLDVWLYKKSGVRIPSNLGYIQRIRDNGFILAVKLTSNYQWDLNNPDEDLYIRFYSNAFFESNRFINGGYDKSTGIDYIGGVYPAEITQQTISNWLAPRLTIQNASSTNAKGGLYAFADGKLIWPLNNTNSIPNNCYLEIVFDRSIYRSVKMDYPSLPGFLSELDTKNKRIVVPWLDIKENTILYNDDIDFYIGRGNRGVYYHRNTVDAVRQLTNESFTITDQYVEGYIADNPWLDHNDPTFPMEVPFVLLMLRHSGNNRSLIWEHMHLKEMVKLGKTGFMNALSGSQSNVPIWRAEYIENSKYNLIQRSYDINDFTWQDVFDAYGYNAATRMLLTTDLDGMNNGDATSNNIFYQIPNSFKNATALIFDRTGQFLGCRSGTGGSVILFPTIAGKPDSYFQHAKLIAGKLYNVATNSSFYRETTSTFTEDLRTVGFRCYMCTLVNDEPDNNWREVAEDEGYWELSEDGKTLQWDTAALTAASATTALRLGNHVIYQPNVPFQSEEDGVLQFNINNLVNYNGNQVQRVEHIPYASLLVIVEDKLLVEGIDYFVEWPQVVVTKKYTTKRVSLVMYGLPNSDLTSRVVREHGWSYKGLLSVDGRWHLRDDRNTIVSYGGNVIHPSLIKAYEDYWAVTGFKVLSIHDSVVPYAITDVVPYAVIDVMQSIEGIYPGYDTVEEYTHSYDNDMIVEDYMTENMNFVLPQGANMTPSFWKLYSPFISRIINEMIAGRFDDLPPVNELHSSIIESLVENFLWLLDYDPINRNVNLDNCTVLPHNYNSPVAVTLNQYMFIKRLIDHYLEGKVNLSTQLVVAE